MKETLKAYEELFGFSPESKTNEDRLKEAVNHMSDLGIRPSDKNFRSRLLRAILETIIRFKIDFKHPFIASEEARIQKMKTFYLENKEKYADKSKKWWLETHGVDLTLVRKHSSNYDPYRKSPSLHKRDLS